MQYLESALGGKPVGWKTRWVEDPLGLWKELGVRQLILFFFNEALDFVPSGFGQDSLGMPLGSIQVLGEDLQRSTSRSWEGLVRRMGRVPDRCGWTGLPKE